MTVEFASYISQLDTTLPTAADLISEGDDHIRLTKTVLKTQFPNFGTTAVTASAAELNYSVGVTAPLQAQIGAKGAIAGQAWTGTHSFAGATSVPTLAAGSNTTGAASTAFVQADFLQKFPNYTAPVNASTTELNYLVGLTGAIQPQLSNQVSGPINAAISKTTPVDADELGITDSAASWGLKKLTFANLKAWLGGLFVGKTGAQSMSGALTVGGVLTVSGARTRLLANNEPFALQVNYGATTNGRFLGGEFNGSLLISTDGGAPVARVDTSNNLLLVGGGALGYGIGSGGTVTQATSKSTAVTLNKPSGLITLSGSAILAGQTVSFIFENSLIVYPTLVLVTQFASYPAENYQIWVATGSAGTAVINVKNISSGALSQPLDLLFVLVKGAAS